MIPRDKFLHFVVGLAIVLTLPPFVGAVYAFVVCFIAAIGKEVYDSFFPKTRHVEAWDAIATILGGLAGIPFFL